MSHPTADFICLAEALRYPAPARLVHLRSLGAAMQHAEARRAFARFLDAIQGLTLGQWEELHTHTLDLNPPAAPYIGFQIWAESYPRGSFMAVLNREMAGHAIDLEGELPDHLLPVLRYLAAVPTPIKELHDVLLTALERMHTNLHKRAANNPYLHLLEAVTVLCTSTLPALPLVPRKELT